LDFDAFEVNQRWVFRFPRCAKVQARLRKDVVFLGWLADHLPAPIPRYEWGMLNTPCFPYVFSGYEKLKGVQAIEFDVRDVNCGRLGRWLGRFLRRLHSLQPPETLIEKAGLKAGVTTSHGSEKHLNEYLMRITKSVGTELAVRIQNFFREDHGVPLPYDGPLVLVHEDCHAGHLLLDPEAPERVTGILDWSDMWFSDPAQDFARLFSWGGDRLLEPMLQGYGAADPELARRARYIGVWLALKEWAYFDRLGWKVRATHVQAILEEALPS
jgi:aminoglycoside phosphotransferase (APT) family kinase protein